MKTQKSHRERQIQHSKEVAQHKLNVKEAKVMKRYKMVGYTAIGLWLVWVLMTYLSS